MHYTLRFYRALLFASLFVGVYVVLESMAMVQRSIEAGTGLSVTVGFIGVGTGLTLVIVSVSVIYVVSRKIHG